MRRGDVFVLRFSDRVSHEQRGQHFGVVVQSNTFLPRSAVLVAPTSYRALPASFRPGIELMGHKTRVLVEQVGAADGSRLGELVGHLTPEEQWGVDAAPATLLDLR